MRPLEDGSLAFRFNGKRHVDGNPVENSFETIRLYDGVFTSIEEGQPKNRKVSAIAFYQHRFRNTHRQHLLRVYHNPYALNPLSEDIFRGMPQFVPFKTDADIEMKWIDGPPDEG